MNFTFKKKNKNRLIYNGDMLARPSVGRRRTKPLSMLKLMAEHRSLLIEFSIHISLECDNDHLWERRKLQNSRPCVALNRNTAITFYCVAQNVRNQDTRTTQHVILRYQRASRQPNHI